MSMTKEQEEAIERLNRFKTIEILYGNTFAMHVEQLKTVQGDIETVLSMLQEQQEENKKKDKIIDIMSEKLAKVYHYKPYKCTLKEKNNIDCDKYKDCVSCVKQYWERKAEDVKN